MGPNATPPPAVPEPPTCTICLDPVVALQHDGARSVALLLCGHAFHLDCIGSEFNASGLMQCPNCRNIEDGNWLNPNVPRNIEDDNRLDPNVPRNVEDGNRLNPNVPHSFTDSLWARIAFADFLGESPFDESTALPALDNFVQNRRRRRPISSGLEGGQIAGLSNVQAFDGTEPRNSEIQQHSSQHADQHSMPLGPGGDQVQ